MGRAQYLNKEQPFKIKNVITSLKIHPIVLTRLTSGQTGEVLKEERDEQKSQGNLTEYKSGQRKKK